jgi:hypothetical protein
MADRHAYPTAAAFVPADGDLAALPRTALGCLGCDRYERASQTVFGATAIRPEPGSDDAATRTAPWRP